MSTTHVKTDRRNKAVLKIPEFSHRRCHACAQSLPDSQQVDPQARARWKEDTFMHDMELSDRQEFTGSSRNPDRKNVLQRTKNTAVASVRGTISHKPKLGFPRIPNLAKLGSASFPTVPRTSKSDIGNYVKYARELGQDLRKNALGVKRIFPPGQPPSRAESFRLATS
jgi:hypothetical protein